MLPAAVLLASSCSLDGLASGSTGSSSATGGGSSSTSSASSGAGGGPPEKLFDWVSTFGNEGPQTCKDAAQRIRIANGGSRLLVAADLVGELTIGGVEVGHDGARDVVVWDVVPEAGGASTHHVRDFTGTGTDQHLGAIAASSDGRFAVVGYFGKGTMVLGDGTVATLDNQKTPSKAFAAVYGANGDLEAAWELASAKADGAQTSSRAFGVSFSGDQLLVTGDFEANLTVSNRTIGTGTDVCMVEGDPAIPPSKDAFALALDPSSKNCAWLSEFGSKGNDTKVDTGYAIAPIGDHVLVTGTFFTGMPFGVLPPLTTVGTGTFLATLRAADGTQVDAVALTSTAPLSSRMASVFVVGTDTVYAAGFYDQAATISGEVNGMSMCTLPKPLSSSGQKTHGGVVAKMNVASTGKLGCEMARPVIGAGNVEARSVIAQDGTVFVSGFAAVPLDLGNGALSCPFGEEDAFVFALPPDLSRDPTALVFGSPSSEVAESLAPGFAPGQLLVAGSYAGRWPSCHRLAMPTFSPGSSRGRHPSPACRRSRSQPTIQRRTTTRVGAPSSGTERIPYQSSGMRGSVHSNMNLASMGDRFTQPPLFSSPHASCQ